MLACCRPVVGLLLSAPCVCIRTPSFSFSAGLKHDVRCWIRSLLFAVVIAVICPMTDDLWMIVAESLTGPDRTLSGGGL